MKAEINFLRSKRTDLTEKALRKFDRVKAKK